MSVQCDACGRKYKAIQVDWVKQFDGEGQRVLWNCPNCGRLQKDRVETVEGEKA